MLRIGHKPPSQKGLKRSKESCQRISEAKMGSTHTLEVRQKMSRDRRGTYLEPHHIIPVRNGNKELLFILENGITLCRSCHQKTIWKESSFVEKYKNITAAQM